MVEQPPTALVLDLRASHNRASVSVPVRAFAAGLTDRRRLADRHPGETHAPDAGRAILADVAVFQPGALRSHGVLRVAG
jgi:hypothetical protein